MFFWVTCFLLTNLTGIEKLSIDWEKKGGENPTYIYCDCSLPELQGALPKAEKGIVN